MDTLSTICYAHVSEDGTVRLEYSGKRVKSKAMIPKYKLLSSESDTTEIILKHWKPIVKERNKVIYVPPSEVDDVKLLKLFGVDYS